MLSEQDFDDLVDIDRADLRRHMLLAIAAVFAGILIAVMPGANILPESFDLPEAAAGWITRVAGVCVSGIGTWPVTKMLSLRRSMDRLNMVRRLWRRLKEKGAEAASELGQIEQLVLDAYK